MESSPLVPGLTWEFVVYHIIKRGYKILDLGCYPGSWSLYCKERVGSQGKVVGIDIERPKYEVIEKIDYQTNKSYMVRAKGILKIHGIKQERIIKGIIHVKNNALEISSEFIVPLSDHNISVPKLVYQKIAQEIKVEIKAELVKVEIIQQ